MSGNGTDCVLGILLSRAIHSLIVARNGYKPCAEQLAHLRLMLEEFKRLEKGGEDCQHLLQLLAADGDFFKYRPPNLLAVTLHDTIERLEKLEEKEPPPIGLIARPLDDCKRLWEIAKGAGIVKPPHLTLSVTLERAEAAGAN